MNQILPSGNLVNRRQLETVVGFFRSLRELAPPDVDLGELGALLDPLPEVVPGSSTSNSGGVNSINKSASMSSTKSDDSNNSDGQQQQQHKSKKQALASRLSNVASSVSNASRGAVAKLEGGGSGGDSEEATSAEPVLMPCETE